MATRIVGFTCSASRTWSATAASASSSTIGSITMPARMSPITFSARLVAFRPERVELASLTARPPSLAAFASLAAFVAAPASLAAAAAPAAGRGISGRPALGDRAELAGLDPPQVGADQHGQLPLPAAVLAVAAGDDDRAVGEPERGPDRSRAPDAVDEQAQPLSEVRLQAQAAADPLVQHLAPGVQQRLAQVVAQAVAWQRQPAQLVEGVAGEQLGRDRPDRAGEPGGDVEHEGLHQAPHPADLHADAAVREPGPVAAGAPEGADQHVTPPPASAPRRASAGRTRCAGAHPPR